MRSDAFREELLGAGLLVDGGVQGIYHRSFTLERLVGAVRGYVSASGLGTPMTRLNVGPVQPRSTLEETGYVTSFPNLLGVVTGFAGTEADVPAFLEAVDSGQSWLEHTAPTNLALCSAACHALYPMLSGTVVSADGDRFEVEAWCFRHEPSDDPARMQTFRMHEFVRVGTPEQAATHRDTWLERGRALLADLDLEVEVVPANDPFFGRAGRLLAASQRNKELKFEVTAPISSPSPGAIASANYHEDHFGLPFKMTTPDGATAHTSCFAFGLDRIALALLHRHGVEMTDWPPEALRRLSLDLTHCDGAR